MRKEVAVVSLAILGLFLLSNALALHVIKTSSGETNYTLEAGVNFAFNVSVNITENAQTANVTQVRFTLPSQISFITGSEVSPLGSSFTSTSSTLTWNNSIMLVNGSGGRDLVYFAFTVNGTSLGNYNVSVATTNSSGTFSSNISVLILDTRSPLLAFNSPTQNDYTNKSQNFIEVSGSSSDFNSTYINATLYNSGWTVLSSVSNNSNNVYANFSSLSDGTYRYNLTANDSSGNTNTTTRTITLDRALPTISFDENSITSTTINVSVDVSSDVSSCSVSRGSITKKSPSEWIFFESSLDCDEDYDYNVTCSDFAGNQNSKKSTFTTDGCSSSSSSSSGGGGGGSGSTSSSSSEDTVDWEETFSEDENDVKEVSYIQKELEEKERMKIKVDGDTHYVGVVDIIGEKANISINSDPQYALMGAGETKKFHLDNDAYLDLMVKVESISDDKVNMSVYYVHEDTSTDVAKTSKSANTSGESNSSKTGLYWLLGITGLVALGGIAFYFVRKYRSDE